MDINSKIDIEFEIIQDKYGWILINNSKIKRLSLEKFIIEKFIIDKFIYRIIWKKCHTHVKSLKSAITIRENLIKRILPKYKAERILKSYIRISDNEEYILKIRKLLKEKKHNCRSAVNLAKRIEREDIYVNWK